jgi:hypothetical protein
MPLLLYLRFPTGSGSFGLWLPWFLVYPLVLAIMLLSVPFILLAAVFTLPFGYARPLVFVWPYIWRFLFSLRGLDMNISNGHHDIQLNFV